MQPYTSFDESQSTEIREEVPDISDLLKEMVAKGASDLHLTTESPPMIRVSGQLQALPYRQLDPSTTKGSAAASPALCVWCPGRSPVSRSSACPR